MSVINGMLYKDNLKASKAYENSPLVVNSIPFANFDDKLSIFADTYGNYP